MQAIKSTMNTVIFFSGFILASYEGLLEIALEEVGRGLFLTARFIGFRDCLRTHDFRYEAQEPRHAVERNSSKGIIKNHFNVSREKDLLRVLCELFQGPFRIIFTQPYISVCFGDTN